MSSGAGKASGAGGLDLNCDTGAVLDDLEYRAEEKLEDAQISCGGEVFAGERGEVDGSVADQKQYVDVGIEGAVGSEKVYHYVSLEGSSILTREHNEFQRNLMDGGGELVDSQLRIEESVPEGESHAVDLLEVDTGKKDIGDPITVSAQKLEADEARDHPMNFGDVATGDHKQGISLYAEGIVIYLESEKCKADVLSQRGRFLGVKKGEEVEIESSCEGFVAISSDFRGFKDERSETVLRKEQVEVQSDLGDGTDRVVDDELDTGKMEGEFKYDGERSMEEDTVEKGNAGMVDVLPELSKTVKVSCQATNIIDEPHDDQKQAADINMEGTMKTDALSLSVLTVGRGADYESVERLPIFRREQFQVRMDLADASDSVVHDYIGSGERKAEVHSHEGVPSELHMGKKESANLITASADLFEVIDDVNQALNSGDCTSGDQIQGVEGTILDVQLGHVDKGDAIKCRSRNFSIVDNLDKKLVTISTLKFESIEVSSHATNIGDGSDIEQRQGTDVKAGVPKVESYGRKFVDAGRDNEGSFVLSAASFEESALVKASCEPMNYLDGSSGDQMLENAVDGEAIIRTDDSAILIAGVVPPEDARLERSLDLKKKHLAGGIGIVGQGELMSEAAVKSYGEKCGEAEIGEKQNFELAAASVNQFEAAEHSSHAMNMEDGLARDLKQGTDAGTESLMGNKVFSAVSVVGGGAPDNTELVVSMNLVDVPVLLVDGTEQGIDVNTEVFLDINAHSASALGSGDFEDGRLEESSVLGTEHAEALQISVDGCVHIADSQLFLGEWKPGVESDGGKLTEEKTGAKGEEVFAISAERFESVEVLGQKTNLEHESCSDQKQGSGSNFFSCVVKEFEERSLKRSSFLGNVRTDALQDLVNGYDQVVDGEFGPLKRELEVEPCSEKLEADDVIKKSAVQTLLSAGESYVVEVSSQVMDLEDRFSSKQKQEINANSECIFRINEEFTPFSVDEGSEEIQKGLSKLVKKEEIESAVKDLSESMKTEAVCSVVTIYASQAQPEFSGDKKQFTVFDKRIDDVGEEDNYCPGMPEDIFPHSAKIGSDKFEALKDTGHVEEPAYCKHVEDYRSDSCEDLIVLNAAIDVKTWSSDEQAAVENMIHEGIAILEPTYTIQRANYHLSFLKEGFSPSDLVWGKVKSHPWWPGQIFDPLGASDLALKYQKKDHFLVAYFGDKTFAWCEESRLKPFQLYFPQMESQANSDSFLRAIHDILMEISRRMELSLNCSCLPKETYADIKFQRVDNAGIRGKNVDSVFDRCEVVKCFHPDKLLEYVRALAKFPTCRADRLELTVAQAQLKAFYLSKGYAELPAFAIGSELTETDFETPFSTSNIPREEDELEQSATLSDLFSAKGRFRGRDGTLGKKPIVEDRRKQRSLSELMEDATFILENTSEVPYDESGPSFSSKRKALDDASADMTRIKTLKHDSPVSPTSNSSFKVGEFVSRAASKLTRETSKRSLFKTDDRGMDYMNIEDFLDVTSESPKLHMKISRGYPPTNEILSKLCLVARNPMKVYTFTSIVISFFSIFRNVRVSSVSFGQKTMPEKPGVKRGRKKKIISDLKSLDASTPDHMKDSYWSDMIIPEKDAALNPPKKRGRKKKIEFVNDSSPSLMLNSPSSDCELKICSHAGSVCPHLKFVLTTERPIISVEEKIVDERLPTAVILYFNGSKSLPSDADLIRIFSRFGPLKGEETCTDEKNNSAIVVFKKRADAEMAFSCAWKYSSFGPALLSYQIKHFPLEPTPEIALTDDHVVAAVPIKETLDDIPGFCSASNSKLHGNESCTFTELLPVQFEDVNRGPSHFLNTTYVETVSSAASNIEREESPLDLSYFDTCQTFSSSSLGAEAGENEGSDFPAGLLKFR